jgi:signal transduction histidine kinase
MPYEGIDDAARLRRLLDAVLFLGSELRVPTVLRRIVEAACELVGARYGALGVLDERREGLTEFITVGVSARQIEHIGSLPRGHGILGLLIVDPRPLRLSNLNEHPERYGFPAHHPPMTSFLGVPVLARGEVFGNLYLTDKRGGEGFTQDDEDLIVALAAAAGVAIENARLHARARELDVVTDRERIARDLHDTVIQRLFATGLLLQAAGRVATGELADRIQEAVDDLDETIRQIRSTIFALGVHQAGASLRAEVLAVAAEASQSLGFDPRVQLDGPIDAVVPDDTAEHVLSVLREALSNVARHARANRVEVVLQVGDEDLVLRVNDDGTGPGEGGAGREGRAGGGGVGAGGFGLRNMRSRAEAMGGSLVVEPAMGGGTLLEWRVPLRS